MLLVMAFMRTTTEIHFHKPPKQIEWQQSVTYKDEMRFLQPASLFSLVGQDEKKDTSKENVAPMLWGGSTGGADPSKGLLLLLLAFRSELGSTVKAGSYSTRVYIVNVQHGHRLGTMWSCPPFAALAARLPVAQISQPTSSYLLPFFFFLLL